MENTHVFIKEHIQTLQTEFLKYDQLIVDNRKINDANAIIKNELEQEQKQCHHLEERIQALQQAEGHLKGRLIQLECELRDLRNAAHEKDLNPTISEAALSDLHQQLNQANDSLVSANDKIAQLDKIQKELETTSMQYEVQVPVMYSKLTGSLTHPRKSTTNLLKTSKKQMHNASRCRR